MTSRDLDLRGGTIALSDSEGNRGGLDGVGVGVGVRFGFNGVEIVATIVLISEILIVTVIYSVIINQNQFQIHR